jgi:hypothetical protein
MEELVVGKEQEQQEHEQQQQEHEQQQQQQQQQQAPDESLLCIQADVKRCLTFLQTHFVHFSSTGNCDHIYHSGNICQSSLVRVLLLFSKVQSSVGYCQGLVMLAAAFLYVLPPQLCVQALLHAVGCIMPLHYFSPSMSALQVDLAVCTPCFHVTAFRF